MAYQINGNVVIDDSGNGIFENLALVQKPTNVDPTEGEDVLGSNISLLFSNFATLYPNVAHSYTVFEVANALSFASANIVHSGNVDGSNTVYFDNNVVIDTFYWRAKYIDNRGNNSEFSDASSFNVTSLYPPPDGLGCPYQGGFFTGNVDIGGGVCYYLILSPNATGCACCQWKTTQTLTASSSRCNGYDNTYTYLNNATHPAGNFTATRTISGYSDWYLPAIDELIELYNNKDSLPAGELWSSELSTGFHWSSTRYSNYAACRKSFCSGAEDRYGSTYTLRLRAIRRIPII